MPTPSLSPDRRPPAGSGHLIDRAALRPEPLPSMAPDMDRVLGALRDFTRRDILLRFYSDHKARSVDEVAQQTGIHRSVAFDHLERLVALGYLESERRRGFPGKPAKIYRLNAGPLQISHPMRRYDVLAESLAAAIVETSVDGGKAALAGAGETLAWRLGRPGAASLNAALEPLSEMGGEYDTSRRGRIECTNCLFAEVCHRVPAICHLHAGLLGGLLVQAGFVGRVQAHGSRGPSGCAYELEPA